MKHLLLIISVIFCFCAFAQATAQDNSDCLACHDDSEMTLEKNGKTLSAYVAGDKYDKGMHKKQKCISCHSGFDPYSVPHKENIAQVNCKSCHQKPEDSHLFHPKMNEATGTSSRDDINCKNCHSYHYPKKISPADGDYIKHSVELCNKCHAEHFEQYKLSSHFTALQNKNSASPGCLNCHNSGLLIKSLPGYYSKESSTKLCINCHSFQADSAVSSYMIDLTKSNHYSARQRGREETPECIDCHGFHQISSSNDENSLLHKTRITKLCGNCHISLTHEFENSIHGMSAEKGNPDVPTCIYCHGEHSKTSLNKLPESLFLENELTRELAIENNMIYCIGCHSDRDMMKKYDLRVISEGHNWLPMQSKHWKTVKCTDCHTSQLPPNLSHNILPKDQVIRNCEKCHTENTELMAQLYDHEKQLSREKLGYFNGTIQSNAYLLTKSGNAFINTISIIIFAGIFLFLMLHAFVRWYFRKSANTNDNND